MADGALITVIAVIVVIIIVILIFRAGVTFVQEREVVIIERFGSYHRTLQSGFNWIVPIMDKPKNFSVKYYIDDPRSKRSILVSKTTSKVSTATQVMDFPAITAITRDNATIELDSILSYQVLNPREMLYSCKNLPLLLAKLMQSQMRNLAATLNVDQIIEEAATLNRISGMIDNEAARWGVRIQFVKVQQVLVPGMENVLEKQKTAQLNNTKIVTDAKAQKQTWVIESEGEKEGMIRKEEGITSSIISQARGEASKIINIAKAEQRSINEIAAILEKENGDPVRYILSLKYIEAMRDILSSSKTEIRFYTEETAPMQVISTLGMTPFLDVTKIPTKKI